MKIIHPVKNNNTKKDNIFYLARTTLFKIKLYGYKYIQILV